MKFQIRNLFLLFVLALILGCGVSDDPKERADRLGGKLRCPVCRGVPISESPAALAQEMMSLLRQQIEEGKSDEEILSFFEGRYGEWVLLEPKPEGMNLSVWILPALVLVGGGFWILRQSRKAKP